MICDDYMYYIEVDKSQKHGTIKFRASVSVSHINFFFPILPHFDFG